MNILIVGGGKAGIILTQTLCKEGHDITVMDTDSEVVTNVIDNFDAQALEGNGLIVKDLLEAGVEHANVIIAMTESDETNIMCCMMSRKLGARHSIARVRNPMFAEQMVFMREELDISLMVNPEFQTANEIARMLRYPNALHVESFAGGRMELAELHVSPDGVMDGLMLSALPSRLKLRFLVCAVMRGEECLIPDGSFILHGNDKIYITAAHSELSKFYKQFGDIDRLHKVFPALVAYAQWWKLNRTWKDGTYWSSGWGTGMDNMPRVPEGYNQIFSNGHMTWLDTNLQQYLVNDCLMQIGFYIERWQEIEEMEDEMKFLKKWINENMWDDNTGFLYDVYGDGSRNSTKGISAFWALKTDVLDKDRLDRLVAHLSEESEFARTHRVPSLSADHPKYNPKGRYWQGGIWPGANYMVISGLWERGYRKEAMEIANNHFGNVFDVWKDTGTFWEYYAPEETAPGFMARKDFVGWTGLPPIAVFIEYILGIQSDFSEGKVEWDVHNLEAHGIERYPFGPEGVVSLKAAARKSLSDKPVITVTTNIPFDLTVNWGDGQTATVHVGKSGKITL